MPSNDSLKAAVTWYDAISIDTQLHLLYTIFIWKRILKQAQLSLWDQSSENKTQPPASEKTSMLDINTTWILVTFSKKDSSQKE